MSEQIRKIYEKKGVKPPDGKGIHTVAFHDMATSIKRDNPSYPMSRCYQIAMGQLGAEKAVKKSHRRNTSELARAIVRKSKRK
jgi:hypothetical protein